ncbi:MAG: hypothetical protein ACXU84_26615, partial [Xanthobacteraceae bacterium]
HVTDGGNLFHDSLVHPIGLEALAMTARTQEPLREKSRPAVHATPDTNAWSHTAPMMIPVSRVSEARRNGTRDQTQDSRSAILL